MTASVPRIHPPETRDDLLTLFFREGIVSGAAALRQAAYPPDFEALASTAMIDFSRLTPLLIDDLGRLLSGFLLQPRQPKIFVEAVAGASEIGVQLAKATQEAWNGDGRRYIAFVDGRASTTNGERVVVIDGMFDQTSESVRTRQEALQSLRSRGYVVSYLLALIDKRKRTDCDNLYRCRNLSLFVLSEAMRQYWRREH